MELRSIIIGAAVAFAFLYMAVSEPDKVSMAIRGIYIAIALIAVVTIGYGVLDRYGSGQDLQ